MKYHYIILILVIVFASPIIISQKNKMDISEAREQCTSYCEYLKNESNFNYEKLNRQYGGSMMVGTYNWYSSRRYCTGYMGGGSTVCSGQPETVPDWCNTKCPDNLDVLVYRDIGFKITDYCMAKYDNANCYEDPINVECNVVIDDVVLNESFCSCESFESDMKVDCYNLLAKTTSDDTYCDFIDQDNNSINVNHDIEECHEMVDNLRME